MEKIKELGLTDMVRLGNKSLSYDLVTEINPDIIGLGYDQAVDMEKLNNIYSGEVVRLKAYKEDKYKTSKLK